MTANYPFHPTVGAISVHYRTRAWVTAFRDPFLPGCWSPHTPDPVIGHPNSPVDFGRRLVLSYWIGPVDFGSYFGFLFLTFLPCPSPCHFPYLFLSHFVLNYSNFERFDLGWMGDFLYTIVLNVDCFHNYSTVYSHIDQSLWFHS